MPAHTAYRSYADSFKYTAADAVGSMRLGNGKWESTNFNSRLQPTQIALGSAKDATDLLKLNYDYGSNDNNGNVKSQQIAVLISAATIGSFRHFSWTGIKSSGQSSYSSF